MLTAVPSPVPSPVPAAALATAGVVAAVDGVPLLRARLLTRLLLHAVMALVLALVAWVATTAGGGETGLTVRAVCVLVVMTAVATWSWAGSAAHLLAAVAAAVVPAALAGAGATATAVLVLVLVVACATTGRPVRAAGASEVDALTGLSDRRGAERCLDGAAERCGGELALALAVVDLDHVKDVNDTLGHAAGGALLREVAQCLRAACAVVLGAGAERSPARRGGDEWLLRRRWARRWSLRWSTWPAGCCRRRQRCSRPRVAPD